LPLGGGRYNIAGMAGDQEERSRLVAGGPLEGEEGFELKLRPQRLQEFIGQPKVKENLAVAIAAARARGEALGHRGWARRRWRRLSPMRWMRRFSRHPGRRYRSRAT